MSRAERWPTIAVGTLVALGLAAGLVDAVRSGQRDVLGPPKPAPEFDAIAQDGSIVNLDAYRNKVVVIDFFASWCQPCAETMPTLVATVGPYADKGVVLLAASGDDDEPERDSKVRAFFRRIQVQAPTVVYPTKATMERYGIEGFPTTVLIDRTRQARVLGHDAYSEIQLRGMLDRALAEGATTDGGSR